MDGNDKLEQLLQDVVNNTDALKQLSERDRPRRRRTARRTENEQTAEQPGAAPAAAAAATTAEEASLLDQIISEGRLARDEEQRALAKDLIGEFVDQVMDGHDDGLARTPRR